MFLEPKMFEVYHKWEGHEFYSSQRTRPNEEITRWYQTLFEGTYARWWFSLQFGRFYRPELYEDMKQNYVRKEWDGFWITGLYLPILRSKIYVALMRLKPRKKVYPKVEYKDRVREVHQDEYDFCGCGPSPCAVCGTPTSYLPASWKEFGVRWTADFCREHTPEDLK